MLTVPARRVRPTIRPLSPTIGAEVDGIDLRERLRSDVLLWIRGALLDRKVLFFRDQDITAEQQIAFARRFGELEVHPLCSSKDGLPEVSTLDHDQDHPGAENHWHHDVTWRRQPSFGSISRMVSGPPVGGDTLFADMEAAYDNLPAAVRARVDGRVARHDFPHFRDHLRQQGQGEDVVAEFDRRFPNPVHPVIRTHPETGRRSIFVNAAFTQEIVGMSPPESADLLDLLYRQACVPEFQVRFTWRPGSVAFWDNRSCQHYAVSDYWPHDRLMERVTIAGDVPLFEPTPPPPLLHSPFAFCPHVARPYFG